MPSIAQDLESLRGAWHRAALPADPLETVVEPYMARLSDLSDAVEMATSANYRAIADRIVAGEITWTEGMAAFAAAAAANEAVSVSNRASKGRILKDAVFESFRRAARAALAAHADELLGQLQQAHDAVIQEATKLAPAVEGIGDDGSAMRAGEKTAKAWRALTLAAARREDLLAALAALTNLGAVVYPRDAGLGARMFLRPGKAPRIRIDTHPARRLAILIESGAGPAIVAPSAVAARLAEEAAARREHQPAPEPSASKRPAGVWT